MPLFKVTVSDTIQVKYEVYVEAENEDAAHEAVSQTGDLAEGHHESKLKTVERHFIDGEVHEVEPAEALPEDMRELFDKSVR